MTNPPSLKSFYSVTLLAVFFASGCTAANAQSKSEIIEPDPRPVVVAVERLELEYGIPITYEDTKNVGPNEPHTALSFDYEPPPPDAPPEVRKKLAGVALGEAIRNYNAGQGGEIFTVSESEKGFHVVQRNFVVASGKMQEAHPVLDKTITILPQATGSIDEMMLTLCAADAPLWFGEVVANNLFMQNQASIIASNEPARSVLERLLRQIPARSSKQIGPGAYRDTAEGAYWSWEVLGNRLTVSLVKPPGTR